MFGWSVDDVEIDRIMTYVLFAEKFGWTPEQVDNMDAELIMKLKYVVVEIDKERSKIRLDGK